MTRQQSRFPELIPPTYRSLVDSLGASSPLGLAVRESPGEYEDDPLTLEDPIGEGCLKPLPHLVRKYSDRALYLSTPGCLVHCRFCFRRTHLPGAKQPQRENLREVARWLAANPEVDEVIVSGGDPLSLDDSGLGEVLSVLGAADSVSRLRVHTRAPVVCPERVTGALAAVFRASPKPTAVVLHVAHPLELTSEVAGAVATLKACTAGVTSQTVLLKGVNADPKTLASLFMELKGLGVIPRYLHHPDRVAGSRDFRLPLAAGLEIYREVCALMTGSAPPYVIDLPDGSGKTEVSQLSMVEKKYTADGTVRRYLWKRPVGWKGVSKAEEATWWDVPE